MAKKKEETPTSYKLKEGVELRPFGAQCDAITNDNLTPSIAQYLLETGKATLEHFESVDSIDSEQTETTND